MNIALVIPVYNGAAHLETALAAASRFVGQHGHFACEIVVADNGSTDRTLEIARELERQYPVVRSCHLDLKGRGRALKTVWSQHSGDILSYMDVDLSTDLTAFPTMIEALASGGFDLAVGTRLHRESVTRRCWKREIISRCYNRLLRLTLDVHFSDAQCGFKAITRAAAQRLLPAVEDTGWFFDTELLVLAEKCGYRTYEQPVTWTEDPDSRVRLLPTIWGDLKGIVRLYRKLRRGGYRELALKPGIL